jgi:hypothetical protein
MRHLGSIVLSLLLAPVIYALTGIGMVKMAEIHGTGSGIHWVAAGTGLAAMLGAGLLYTLLVLPRLSPLGPVLAGLAYLGAAGWYQIARSSFTRTVHEDLLRVHGAAWAPASAVTVLLAVPLLATIASPRRWRRWADPPAAVPAAAYPPPAGLGATPPYPGVPYPGAPSYPGPVSGPPAPVSAPVSGPPGPAESSEETAVLPTSGPPATTAPASAPTSTSAWPVRDDPDATRKLP